MVQPQHDGALGAAGTRLSRFIAAHVARGNKPDYALAQRRYDAFKDLVSHSDTRGLTEEQIDELVREHCGRARR
jgi:hypothetical protein